MPPHPLDELLRPQLRALLSHADLASGQAAAAADDATIDALQQQLTWQLLPAGAVLMRQGEPGDAMYLLVSGRLRVSQTDRTGRGADDGSGHGDDTGRVLREITRGQIVGEMSLLTDAPRSATLVAVRDSVLARLARPDFDELLRRHPGASLALTRQIISRLQNAGRSAPADRPVTIALLPIGGRADDAAARALAAGLAAELGRHGRVACVDAAAMAALLGAAVPEDAGADRAGASRIAVALDRIEAEHDTVLLLADAAPTAWTRCCARQCDELLLLAHADDPPAPCATELACAQAPGVESDLATGGTAAVGSRASATRVLVLMHDAQRRSPVDTARWLAPRRLRAHVHLRQGHGADVARLARLLGRRGVGLVLSGGGARGAAHAGVYRALRERGVPVDAVGGTSMGAVFGALMAFDTTGDEVVDTFARHFAANPSGDFTLLPLLSLVKGRRLRGMMERTELQFGGASALHIEDLWKTYFCIATNVSNAAEQVLADGPLVGAVMASCAIPGALPPVLRGGSLLCDGGVMNNFPVELMRSTWGIGRVIGVDLDVEHPGRIDLAELPTSRQLLGDWLRPQGRRRYPVPSLASYLMNATALHGTARQRVEALQADLLLRPALPGIGMLQWSRYAEAVEVGYATARRALDEAGGGWVDCGGNGGAGNTG